MEGASGSHGLNFNSWLIRSGDESPGAFGIGRQCGGHQADRVGPAFAWHLGRRLNVIVVIAAPQLCWGVVDWQSDVAIELDWSSERLV